MPHDRTRIWVGLAIVAVTIPAVGTYFVAGKPGDQSGAPLRVASRLDAKDDAPVPVLSRPSRDYRAALEAALARSGVRSPDEALPGGDDDPTFDLDPYDDATDIPAVPDDVPDPVADLAPANPTVPVPDDGLPPVAAPEPSLSLATTGAMSDRDVYTSVVNNLSEADRDEFVRAYGAMSADQRSDLLDGFRQQMQGDGR